MSVRHPPTIVITVHDAFDDVRRCLQALPARTPHDHRLVLIDDASTDPRVAPLLDSVENAQVITHDSNLGYTASINEGCHNACGDVVLLNSDTEVSPDWLGRLTEVAYSRADVGTVTPLSNAAGAFSVPDRGAHELPAGMDVVAMDALLARLSRKARPEAPTGSGFCLYIRREVFDAVGYFDARTFPRGYGEENDFCLRASAAGFVHLVDDATFVYHRRSASLGAERERLSLQAKRLIAGRYPHYRADVARFLRDEHLTALRRDLQAVLGATPPGHAATPPPRPGVLLIAAGDDDAATAMARSVANQFDPLVLRAERGEWRLEGGWPTVSRLDEGRSASDADTLLRHVCRERGVRLVHVRTLAALSGQALAAATRLGLPVCCSISAQEAIALDEQTDSALEACYAVFVTSDEARRVLAGRRRALRRRVRLAPTGGDVDTAALPLRDVYRQALDEAAGTGAGQPRRLQARLRGRGRR